MTDHTLGEGRAAFPLWQGDTSPGEVSRSLRLLATLARKRGLLVLAWTVLLVGLGAVYSAMLRPEYTSTIQILLQPRQVINDGPEDRRHYHQYVLDNQQCETELALVTSQEALRTVYQALRIGESDEVRNRFDSISSSLRALISPTGTAGTTPDYDYGFQRFVGRIRARRTGLSYILNVTYRSYDPDQASRVVGSIANAYVASRLRSANARYRLSGPYLERRAELLRQQVAVATEGIRTGKIPEKDFQELDVRILGQPDTTLSPVYPRRTPLLVTLTALGLVSGSLTLLFFAYRANTRRNNASSLY
jgi:uncharacterized protein involved in exopolysaccharide biosynthesis